jgi:putative ABC transport system substrate-binding protein
MAPTCTRNTAAPPGTWRASLKGAQPGDLPVEQAARFALAINLRAARAFGLTMPRGLVLQATEEIE